MRAATLPMLVTLGLATACGGGSEPAATSTTGGGAGGAVAATLKDFAITATPTATGDGTVTVTVQNDGPATHALAIDGNGFAGAATGSIAAGGSATLTVKLPAGTYHLYCPIGGHRGLGMDTTITIGPGGSGSPPPGSTASHAWS